MKSERYGPEGYNAVKQFYRLLPECVRDCPQKQLPSVLPPALPRPAPTSAELPGYTL
jgi:hypothetical protein